MRTTRYPLLDQINACVWLTELSQQLGRSATLDDIPGTELDRLVTLGFDGVWFLSVWQTGPGAQQVSRTNAEWRREFQETLPDLREEDIAGSGNQPFKHGQATTIMNIHCLSTFVSRQDLSTIRAGGPSPCSFHLC
jgi:hypothetical protein